MKTDFVIAYLMLGVAFGITGALISWIVVTIRKKIELRKSIQKGQNWPFGLKIGDSSLDEAYEKWCDDYDAEVDGFDIAGINFRNLDSSHLGEFKGYVKLEPTNPHDSRAIAIYSGRKKMGYIPRYETSLIYESVQANGGKQSCIGFVHTFINEFHEERFAGKVIIGPEPYLEPKRDSSEDLLL